MHNTYKYLVTNIEKMKRLSKDHQEWALPSGTWSSDDDGGDFKQVSTRQGHALESWAQELVPMSIDGATGAVFPPEFKFHPLTGAELHVQSVSPDQPRWIPPCGNSQEVEKGKVRGLRQTPQALVLRGSKDRKGTDHAEHGIPKPGTGDFEFFSVPCASLKPILLAMEPARGQLFAWSGSEPQWMLVTHAHNLVLSECRQVSDDGWRAEVVVSADEFSSIVFAPSNDGLAAIRVDVPALVFDVTYLGGAASVGSPILFADHIWAPVRKLGEPLRLISSNEKGELVHDIVVQGAGMPQVFGRMQAPVTDARRAFWMCDEGYVLLERTSDGSCVASFVRWPSDLVPSFQFGAPYLANNGDLWQICWCAEGNQYEYINLMGAHVQRQVASRPLMCTGSMSYRYVQRVTDDPWYEPEHGVDGGQTQHILPVLESSTSKAVLGLRVSAAGSLKDLLESAGKVPAELVCDAGVLTAFDSMSVRDPWRMRFFVHDKKLWAFHLDLQQILGWELEK